LNAVYVVIFVR